MSDRTSATLVPPRQARRAPPQIDGVARLRLPAQWLLNDDALEQIDQLNPGWRIERGYDGELVINMGATGWSPNICSWICAQLHLWSHAGGGGFVQDSSAGFNLDDGEGRSPEWEPDASWISDEQFAAVGRRPPTSGFWNLCPAFVVEVISPRDSRPDQRRKMEGWLHFGAQLGWLIDPEARTVSIYRSDAEVEEFQRPTRVSGEPLLQGFAVDFAPIWRMIDAAADTGE